MGKRRSDSAEEQSSGSSHRSHSGHPASARREYEVPHLQIDAQGSVRLKHGLSFVMYGLNLNNEVFGFYNGSKQYMLQREYYRPTVAAGFRWNPVFEHK